MYVYVVVAGKIYEGYSVKQITGSRATAYEYAEVLAEQLGMSELEHVPYDAQDYFVIATWWNEEGVDYIRILRKDVLLMERRC